MKANQKAIAITGASGFIGSSLLKQALKQGHRVAVISNNQSNKYRLEGVSGYELITYNNNFNEADTIKRLKEFEPDLLIHSAWKGVSSQDRNQATQFDNIDMTLNSIKLATESKCSGWMGIGSHAEYGTHNQATNESCQTQPTTIYGKVKLASFWAAQAYCQANNLDFSWVRLYDPYGPFDNTNWFIPYLINTMHSGQIANLTKCEQKWDYLYIDDAIAAILTLIKGNHHGTYNIASGEVISLKEVAQKIKELLPNATEPNYGAVDYRPDQIMHLQADVSKLKKLGWQAKTNIDEGLKLTVDWFMRQPVLHNF